MDRIQLYISQIFKAVTMQQHQQSKYSLKNSDISSKSQHRPVPSLDRESNRDRLIPVLSMQSSDPKQSSNDYHPQFIINESHLNVVIQQLNQFEQYPERKQPQSFLNQGKYRQSHNSQKVKQVNQAIIIPKPFKSEHDKVSIISRLQAPQPSKDKKIAELQNKIEKISVQTQITSAQVKQILNILTKLLPNNIPLQNDHSLIRQPHQIQRYNFNERQAGYLEMPIKDRLTGRIRKQKIPPTTSYEKNNSVEDQEKRHQSQRYNQLQCQKVRVVQDSQSQPQCQKVRLVQDSQSQIQIKDALELKDTISVPVVNSDYPQLQTKQECLSNRFMENLSKKKKNQLKQDERADQNPGKISDRLCQIQVLQTTKQLASQPCNQQISLCLKQSASKHSSSDTTLINHGQRLNKRQTLDSEPVKSSSTYGSQPYIANQWKNENSSQDQINLNNGPNSGNNSGLKGNNFLKSNDQQTKDRCHMSSLVPLKDGKQMENLNQCQSLNPITKKNTFKVKLEQPPSNPNQPYQQSSNPSGSAKAPNSSCEKCILLEAKFENMSLKMQEKTDKMEEMSHKMQDKTEKMEEMSQKMQEKTEKMEKMQQKMEKMQQKMEKMQQKMEKMQQKMEKMMQKMHEQMEKMQEKMHEQMEKMQEKMQLMMQLMTQKLNSNQVNLPSKNNIDKQKQITMPITQKEQSEN